LTFEFFADSDGFTYVMLHRKISNPLFRKVDKHVQYRVVEHRGPLHLYRLRHYSFTASVNRLKPAGYLMHQHL
jgi:hypothetical protein